MSHTFTLFQKLKTVNALGKGSARADDKYNDKPGYFFGGLMRIARFCCMTHIHICCPKKLQIIYSIDQLSLNHVTSSLLELTVDSASGDSVKSSRELPGSELVVSTKRNAWQSRAKICVAAACTAVH